MSNIQTNLIAEFEKKGFSSAKFTLAELRGLFEKDGVLAINGQNYDSAHFGTMFANNSVGPGSRVGESVKRGAAPLFIKHLEPATYSIFDKYASVDSFQAHLLEKQSQSSPVAKTRNKAELFNMDFSVNPFVLPSLKSAHSEFFAANLLNAKSESWAGGNILEFASYISGKEITVNLSDYPNIKLARNGLFELVSDRTNNTFKCCIAILAWGGMNREHAVSAFSSWNEWEHIATNIRNGELTRREAYKAFYQLRKSKKLKGLGPAYFTKIIYFLSKEENRGYIMDQWTARSVNLLLETKAIGLTKITAKSKKVSFFVTDKNTDLIYENFCQFVEQLAQLHQTTPDLVEMSLFSRGYGQGPWRNYVISHDSYLYS